MGSVPVCLTILLHKMSFLIYNMRDKLISMCFTFLFKTWHLVPWITYHEHAPFSGLCPHHRYPSLVLGVYLLHKCVLAGCVLLLCTKKLRKPAAKLFTTMMFWNGVERVSLWVSRWAAICKVNFSHLWVAWADILFFHWDETNSVFTGHKSAPWKAQHICIWGREFLSKSSINFLWTIDVSHKQAEDELN